MDLQKIDRVIARYMQAHGTALLRYSVALIFIWFGILKIIGYSPATALVEKTVYWVDASWFVPFLGWWEVVIGVCFLFLPFVRIGIGLLAPQMVGTFLPLFLLPAITFQGSILLPTLEGQYIIKNLLIISAAIVIGAHVNDKR
jgi:uncharacterized membrane protein YkgB